MRSDTKGLDVGGRWFLIDRIGKGRELTHTE